MLENNVHNSEDLALISNAAQQAGKTALSFFGNDPKVWIKPGNSPVSEGDFAADKVLKELLLTARPDYGWISEETRDERPHNDYKRYFVVDPIDGTRGFLSGSKHWCVSVAVVEDGISQVGVLDCPATQSVYKAERGKGASLNGNKLPLLEAHEGKLVVSATGKFEAKLPEVFKSNVTFAHYLPSLAYRIALAAEGKIDVVLIKPESHDWDIAAADLILQECGGLIRDIDNKTPLYGKAPFEHDFLIAGLNRELDNVIDIVRKIRFR
ncbi:3'(2'),5'-bisphosphate nucleotidase CysQ [Bartonella sp. B10834G6]|uniref:3'(2'),5'-bisphosphate nucleotidase CysQ n=1 Tax=Bartonella apis TaxID=1686310 RepID=UPI0018DBA308|nr:3'(2'),5'-bisphosphate nucleotidase CysQ [Bartonella apis]MBH9981754.1 3'(2'),5'-bisphosphate nucleotidase CysQ [Bartonella apis]MBI0176874.1 3'(2'),5'-bisphosphate nucleotidase CysQ [Bartonella apis]